eukprot:sb/3478105/
MFIPIKKISVRIKIDIVEQPCQVTALNHIGNYGGLGGTFLLPQTDINPDARLMVDGVSAKDVDQGRLGNCWFVASVACIAQDPLLLEKVSSMVGLVQWLVFWG